MIAAQSTADGSEAVAAAMAGALTALEAMVGMVWCPLGSAMLLLMPFTRVDQRRPRNERMNKTTTTSPTR